MRNFTEKERLKLKLFWKQLQTIEANFGYQIEKLEENMQRKLKIDDLEFFKSDDGYCGIGNLSRTIKLIHSYELEK